MHNTQSLDWNARANEWCVAGVKPGQPTLEWLFLKDQQALAMLRKLKECAGPAEGTKSDGKILPTGWAAQSIKLQRDLTLLHGDFHKGNIMYRKQQGAAHSGGQPTTQCVVGLLLSLCETRSADRAQHTHTQKLGVLTERNTHTHTHTHARARTHCSHTHARAHTHAHA